MCMPSRTRLPEAPSRSRLRCLSSQRCCGPFPCLLSCSMMHGSPAKQGQPPGLGRWVKPTWLVVTCGAATWLLLARRQPQSIQQLEGADPGQEQDAGRWREQERRQQLLRVQRQRCVEPGLAAELALNRMLFQASHAQRIEVSCCAIPPPGSLEWQQAAEWLGPAPERSLSRGKGMHALKSMHLQACRRGPSTPCLTGCPLPAPPPQLPTNLKLVAMAWNLKRHSNGLLARLLRWLGCPDSADLHNKSALCVMTPPALDTASPAELVKFFNRAGGCSGAGSTRNTHGEQRLYCRPQSVAWLPIATSAACSTPGYTSWPRDVQGSMQLPARCHPTLRQRRKRSTEPCGVLPPSS